MNASDSPDHQDRCVNLHLQVGWWSLLIFLTLGIVLETLHGLKVGWYLDVGNEARRLMWNLAHAHGTLVGLIHLGFANTVTIHAHWNPSSRTVASRCLLSAGILLPLGFFLGGIVIYDGDPGLGVFLVPPGGLLLLIAVLLTAQSTRKLRSKSSSEIP
jgi:hypothetical protein